MDFDALARSQEPFGFAAAGDRAGREWVAALAALTREMCRRWGLELTDETSHHGYHAVVIPVRRGSVRRGSEPCVLKLTWPTARAIQEARALAVWDGRGAVRMFEVETDAGALLLERLDSTRTLRHLNLVDAASLAGGLLRRLAVPAPHGFSKLPAMAADIARTLDVRQERFRHSVPAAWLDAARTLAQRFAGASGKDLLIHADLHYDNVLAGRREPWLAIDPKPVAGDPEFAVPELLWTRVDEVDGEPGIRHLLSVLVESAELDAEKARGWAVVRCVDYWLWGSDACPFRKRGRATKSGGRGGSSFGRGERGQRHEERGERRVEQSRRSCGPHCHLPCLLWWVEAA